MIISLMIMSAAFIFSQSRGAWISLVICLIVMNNVLIKKRILKKQSLFVFLLVITLGLAFLLGGYDIVAERLHTVEQAGSEASLGTRIKIWQGAINMIKANPLIGTGIGTFDWGFQAYRPEGLRVRAYFAHNDYLHMMAEMGLLALPLMLWMIWVVVTAGFKWKEDKGQDAGGDNYKHEKKSRLTLTEGVVLGAAVGVLSLSLHGLVDFNFHIPANMLVVAALSGIIARRASKNI
ncbi:MAG: O-antigen ligase family protein [Candidatus Omnitrophica bacterium]|nr:O-antigen ligase family protein [Candidatus Omnitrophota bacterium]